MAATDYFKKTGNSTATTMSSPGHLIGGTSITVGSTANWPTTTGSTFAIDSVTLNGTEEVQVPGTYTVWHGQVVGSTITNMTLAAESPNSDQNYAAGSLTRVYIPVSAALHNKMVDGILTHADQDGTLKADSVDVTAVIKDNVVSNAKLSEFKPSEVLADYVVSGGVVAQTAGLTGSFSDIVFYISGVRYTKTGVANKTYTASKDTYVDIDATGTVYYTEVANGATTGYTLTAGRLRIAKVVTSGAAITTVTQNPNSDGVGNPFRNLGAVGANKLFNPYKFSVYQTTAGNLGASPGKVLYDTAEFDTGANVDLVTNKGRFTAPIAGFYHFDATFSGVLATSNISQARIYKNGTLLKAGSLVWQSTGSDFTTSAQVSATIQLAVGDYIEVYAFGTIGKAIQTGKEWTNFSGYLVSVT